MTPPKEHPPPGDSDKKDNTDLEQAKEKLTYPKSVFFIVTNEFCERFSYYGLRTILVLYLNYILGYSSDDSTVIYHVFVMFAYFFPVLGAIVADSWLGKYKTILYLSIIYAVGNIIVAITAITSLNIPQSELTIVGLLLIALGTGGIKPCVSAFGGDQFVVPQQELQLQRFFSIFYFSINAGSFISTFLTPVLREDVKCFGEESCFPLAFGVPAMLMVASIAAFVLGSRWYVMKAPEGNIIVEVSKCMWHAITKGKGEKTNHWLDKASDKFDKDFIEDVKAALRVLVLYIPLPLFWALFDQQGSRWTFQAARMDGELPGFTLKPDQVQVLNPILILLFIPLFETVVYPLFNKINLLKRPLQKLVAGGVLAGLAFVVSAIVEFQLEGTYPILPVQGEGQLRLYNVMGCNTEVTIGSAYPFPLKNLGNWENISIPLPNGDVPIELRWNDCDNRLQSSQITIYDNNATSYTLYNSEEPYTSRGENLDKSDDGDPMVMVILNNKGLQNWKQNVTFLTDDGTEKYTAQLNSTTIELPFTKISSGNSYSVKIGQNTVNKKFTLKQGGSYVLLAMEEGTEVFAELVEVTEPNSVNMLWLIPQYVILTAGEIMFSIPGLEFSFTQSPLSMKSLMQAMWLLAVAFGNLIVIIVAEAKFFDSQAYEFLLFAGLMFLDMIIFTLMAIRYKYVTPKSDGELPVKSEDEPNGNSIPLKEKD